MSAKSQRIPDQPEWEARLMLLRDAVRRMHEHDDTHGCGFYNSPAWLKEYRATRELAGLEWRGSMFDKDRLP